MKKNSIPGTKKQITLKSPEIARLLRATKAYEAETGHQCEFQAVAYEVDGKSYPDILIHDLTTGDEISSSALADAAESPVAQ